MGAIAAGALVYFYGWNKADPLFSAVIALLIIYSSWRLIREATNVLLEGTPSHINLASVEGEIRATGGVEDVHDLHAGHHPGAEALSSPFPRPEFRTNLLKELRATSRPLRIAT